MDSTPDKQQRQDDAYKLYCDAFAEIYGPGVQLAISPNALQLMVERAHRSHELPKCEREGGCRFRHNQCAEVGTCLDDSFRPERPSTTATPPLGAPVSSIGTPSNEAIRNVFHHYCARLDGIQCVTVEEFILAVRECLTFAPSAMVPRGDLEKAQQVVGAIVTACERLGIDYATIHATASDVMREALAAETSASTDGGAKA